ncbi:MAG: hypothetical protein C4547_02180, partial [Phycisphaerales bacterium]
AYPSSWKAAEGERPHIVQKFVSEGGRGFEIVMIITSDLPLPPGTVITEQGQREMFAPSELGDMLPEGATFVNAQSTQIEGVPAGILEYRMPGERAGMKFMSQAWILNFLIGKTLVQVQFSVAELPGSNDDVSSRMTAFKPLFTLMANSIVFPDKWIPASEAPASTITPSSSSFPLPLDDPPLLVMTVVVSLIVTWTLGLTPPLLIRYVFVRRPLSKMAASWIAAGFAAFFWLGFRALSQTQWVRSGTGAVWIIMFFVARWIMSRGYRLRTQSPEPTSEGLRP